jgi:hypothetical protein
VVASADLAMTGRCLCASVRYELAGTIRNLCFCHCASCRRGAGASPVAWGTVENTHLKITGDLAVVASSPGVERGFCRACGSSITYRNAKRPGEVDFTLATLDDAAALAPRMHIWVQDKLPWVTISDGLPQHARVP